MKHNNQHIIKKSYAKPVIEEVMLDRDMSLVMISGTPSTEPDPNNGDDDLPVPAPNYEEKTYTPTKNPFGGSRPAY